MATYRKNGGGSTDLPLTDGTIIAVLGPLPETQYDREEVGPMFQVCAVNGEYAGQHFALFEDEIEEEDRPIRL
jgi:hypothetical protein